MDRSEAAARFGQILKEARLQSGLNQEQLAARIETDQTAVSAWERGKYLPDLEVVLRIEKTYGMPPGTLTKVRGWLPCEPEIVVPPVVRANVMPDPVQARIEELERTMAAMTEEIEAMRAQRQPRTAAESAADPAPGASRRRRRA